MKSGIVCVRFKCYQRLTAFQTLPRVPKWFHLEPFAPEHSSIFPQWRFCQTLSPKPSQMFALPRTVTEGDDHSLTAVETTAVA